MGYANLPQTEPVCNLCTVSIKSRVDSFKNAGIQRYHLLPVTSRPLTISQDPADFLATQFGFCNSTQIPSKLWKADLPATFNAYCSKAKYAIFACTNSTFVASCTRSCTLSTWTFFSPYLAATAPGALLAMFSPVCHQKIRKILLSASYSRLQVPDSRLLEEKPRSLLQKWARHQFIFETIKYFGEKNFHT